MHLAEAAVTDLSSWGRVQAQGQYALETELSCICLAMLAWRKV
jgi:hypothetical protein